MKVIMLKELKKLGKSGDVVETKDGYARNYLIPRGLALEATKENFQQIEQIQSRQKKVLKKKEEWASQLKEKIEKLSLTITSEAKDDDELYGSVNMAQIEKGLRAEGIDLDSELIAMPEPIKKLGVYNLEVKLHPSVNATLRVWVVKK